MEKNISRRSVLVFGAVALPTGLVLGLDRVRQETPNDTTLRIKFENKDHQEHSVDGEVQFETSSSITKNFQLTLPSSKTKYVSFEIPEGSEDLVKISIALDGSLIASTDISLKRVPGSYPISVNSSDDVDFYAEP